MATVIAAATVGLSSAGSPLCGATSTWTNPLGGTYSDAANWNGGAGPVPGSGDTALFDLAATYTVGFSGQPSQDVAVTQTAGDVTLASAGAFVAGFTSFAVQGGAFTVGAGTRMAVNGPSSVGGAASEGRLILANSASTTFAGSMSVSNSTAGIVGVNIESNAYGLVMGSLTVADGNEARVAGAGSMLSVTDSNSVHIGGSAGGGKLRALTGASVLLFTDLLTVQGTGSEASADATSQFRLSGDVLADGGTVKLTAWNNGRTATGTNGGTIALPPSANLAGNTLVAQNIGSRFTGGAVTLREGSALTVTGEQSGVVLSRLNLGTDGTDASVTVDGAGNYFHLTSSPSVIGGALGTGTATINVLNGADFFMIASATSLVLHPTATMNITGGDVRTESLSVAGGKVNFDAGTFTVGAKFGVTDGGQVDVNDNAFIVRSGGNYAVGSLVGSTYTGVSGMIASGRNAGTWDGAGVVASEADAIAGLTSIGIARADALGLVGSVYGGVTLGDSDVIVAYTYAGDANLDGVISGDDYSAIDFASGVAGAYGWANGDFNYDGVISGDDYSIIDFNLVAQGAPIVHDGMASAPAVTAVPEPGASTGLLAASLAFLRRKRRKTA